MTKKFKTDKTAGGYTILSFHGPDKDGDYAGVLGRHGGLAGFTWNAEGHTTDGAGKRDYAYDSCDLVPAEPVIEYRGCKVTRRGNYAPLVYEPSHPTDGNLKLGFDAETGELLPAEVLK